MAGDRLEVRAEGSKGDVDRIAVGRRREQPAASGWNAVDPGEIDAGNLIAGELPPAALEPHPLEIVDQRAGRAVEVDDARETPAGRKAAAVLVHLEAERPEEVGQGTRMFSGHELSVASELDPDRGVARHLVVELGAQSGLVAAEVEERRRNSGERYRERDSRLEPIGDRRAPGYELASCRARGPHAEGRGEAAGGRATAVVEAVAAEVEPACGVPGGAEGRSCGATAVALEAHDQRVAGFGEGGEPAVAGPERAVGLAHEAAAHEGAAGIAHHREPPGVLRLGISGELGGDQLLLDELARGAHERYRLRRDVARDGAGDGLTTERTGEEDRARRRRVRQLELELDGGTGERASDEGAEAGAAQEITDEIASAALHELEGETALAAREVERESPGSVGARRIGGVGPALRVARLETVVKDRGIADRGGSARSEQEESEGELPRNQPAFP